MNPYEIFIVFISWGASGKKRPVLVVSTTGEKIIIYPITTQYDGKSKTVKDNYFEISDWEEAGLYKKSYADIATAYRLPKSAFNDLLPIGKLSEKDKQSLIKFLSI